MKTCNSLIKWLVLACFSAILISCEENCEPVASNEDFAVSPRSKENWEDAPVLDWAHIIVNPSKYHGKIIRLRGTLKMLCKGSEAIEGSVEDGSGNRGPWRSVVLLWPHELYKLVVRNGCGEMAEGLALLDGRKCLVTGRFDMRDPSRLTPAMFSELYRVNFFIGGTDDLYGDPDSRPRRKRESKTLASHRVKISRRHPP